MLVMIRGPSTNSTSLRSLTSSVSPLRTSHPRCLLKVSMAALVKLKKALCAAYLVMGSGSCSLLARGPAAC